MTSTSDSKKILEIKDLKLFFPVRVHQATSLRDVFIRTVSNPIRTLLNPPEMLEVVAGLDLNISHGDRVALMGVNGAGKTSLCRTIAGIYRPTSGDVRLYGKSRALFDTVVGIFPELTGRENAHVLADFVYPHLDRRSEKIREALEFSELKEFLDTPFKYYSNGMQARLCLSILTIEPTDLLILDEVIEGVDRFFREKISRRIFKLIENSGAVIFISHNDDQLRQVCNRAVVLINGKIAFDGSIEDGISFYHKKDL